MALFVAYVLLVAVVLLLSTYCSAYLSTVAKVFDYPLHASCKDVKWTFASESCNTVAKAIEGAAKSMQGLDNCNGGMKCGYDVISSDVNGGFVGTHMTPTAHYIDDVSFNYKAAEGKKGCIATGSSTSETWYAYLDNSVNYCNLKNLIDATGLKYEESDVSDKTCTQYSSADCSKF